MKVLSSFAVMALVAGCSLPMGQFEMATTGSEGVLSLPVAMSGNCGASGLQGLMEQSESVLASTTLPENTRIIRPGTTFTEDARPSRLNIGVSASGTIVHVACG
ncbi:MAG: hypothetical protein L3J37_08870 [Rhodobacteraceae bacterium]|nr:hypothetical protein [Paracoccaceae bacterium]